MKSTSKSIIFSMSYRNIRRNMRRSLLSASTIAIIAVSVCFMFSIIYGMLDDMEMNIINQVAGNIRVRNQLYSDNERIQPLQFSIPETDKLLSFIKSQKGVVGAEPQININVVVDPNGESTATTVIGLDFKTSRFFSDRHTKIISGRIPSTDEKNAVIITTFMANHFNLKVGDKFTMLTRTAIGQNAVTFIVSGIATIGNSDFFGLNFFVNWKELSEKLRMGGNTLEILIHTEDGLSRAKTKNIVLSIQNYVKSDTGLEVKEWYEVSMMTQMFQFTEIIYIFMALIFFLMAATIIFNSTMMAVLERKKEIGTLMSLGMDAKHIKNLFLLESTLLAFIASLVGTIFGFLLISIFEVTGINIAALGGNALSGVSLSNWIYPTLSFGGYLLVLFMGTFIATIACIIPAHMTLKVQPAEALRSAE